MICKHIIITNIVIIKRLIIYCIKLKRLIIIFVYKNVTGNIFQDIPVIKNNKNKEKVNIIYIIKIAYKCIKSMHRRFHRI